MVGAGIAGLSTGLFLRRRTGGRIVVIDSGTPGCGASGHGSGIIRVHNSDLDEMLLAESGARVFRNWTEVIGGADVFSRRGVLWLVGTGDVETLTRNVRAQKTLGLSAELLGPRDVAVLVPGIRVGDLGGAAYDPDGGTVIGPDVMNALAVQALAEGVELRTFEPVRRLLTRGGAVAGVETDAGVVDAPTVVVAAGAWTRNVLLTAGVDLPIQAVRATIGTVYAPPSLREAPAVFDEVNDASYVPKQNGTAVISARARRTPWPP
ncbi:hypothetical protein GCM10017673_31400 [Streptosporangium violaceochromogenes]|nr:hypothetical protein GCM10017673_31400 [Streptosporangium violaceochromogenes]